MNLKKITAYTVYVNPQTHYFWVRLRLDNNNDDIFDLKVENLPDLTAIVDLLRNESHILFDTQTQNIVIGWEQAGELHP
ncbi:MAG: hypothetical protein MUE85_09195 [Microscillaceae bacterium]|jgi:hypothetical protein|nr:hypothetical protein [Microscillaceae bacterium]